MKVNNGLRGALLIVSRNLFVLFSEAKNVKGVKFGGRRWLIMATHISKYSRRNST
jgi:hypothetical protein